MVGLKTLGKVTLAGLFIALFAVVTVAPVNAAETTDERESIALSPVNKRYEINAGEAREDKFTVINDGNIAFDFVVYTRPYSVTNEKYDPSFTETQGNADAYKWVSFDQARYQLEPGKSIEIPYTMRVPSNAAPGGHFGVVFVETQPKDGGQSAVVRKKRVGMILYATVNGTYQIGGEKLGTSIPFLQHRSPLSATTRVKNTGNADFVVTSTLTVKDIFGNAKHQQKKENAVLPSTTRAIPLEWTNSPWFGLFNVEVTSQFLDKKQTDSGLVLLVPRWLLAVIALVVIGAVIYGIARRRKKA